MRRTIKDVKRRAEGLGLYVSTERLGDGVLRISFSRIATQDYYSSHYIQRCLGAKDADTWLDGFQFALEGAKGNV